MHNPRVTVDYQTDSTRVTAEFCFGQDLKRLDFEIAGNSAAVFYVDGMSDGARFENNIIKPLKQAQEFKQPFLDNLNKITYSSDKIDPFEDFDEFTKKIADGDIGLIIHGADAFYVYSAKGYSVRGIQEPPVNSVLHGPREGFNEDLKNNLTMIRRRLRTPKLVTENIKVGKYSQTGVALLHLNGVAEPKIVENIKSKLDEISIDGIIDSSYIARFLEDRKHSIFRQVGIAEKPDVVAAKILEGRVAIVCDGSPIVLTLPFLFIENYQAAEDYYVKNVRGTLTRGIRIASQSAALLLPALYVAVQSFQYHILPLRFLTVIMNNIYGLPFPPMLEMLLVLLFFEMLNEAGVKMPRHLVLSLSIVGALILGEAATRAGLLSGITVLVMAISTLGIYTAPDAADAASILRLIFVIIAGVLGMLGIALAALATVAYMCSLKSAGVSMMSPFAPSLLSDMKDTFFKTDVTEASQRPMSIPSVNKKRLEK